MGKDSLGTIVECKKEIRELKQKAKQAKTEAEKEEIEEKIRHYETLAKNIKGLSRGKVSGKFGINHDVEVR